MHIYRKVRKYLLLERFINLVINYFSIISVLTFKLLLVFKEFLTNSAHGSQDSKVDYKNFKTEYLYAKVITVA